MPSTTSNSFSSPWPSSTVMTPSLPTFSIASARVAPMDSSEFAEIVPTCAMPLESLHGFEKRFNSSVVTSTALSMPRLMSMGLRPDATAFRPSRMIACARTVAVVVPSPASSEEHRVAALRAECGLDRICQDVDALEHAPARIITESYFFRSHCRVLGCVYFDSMTAMTSSSRMTTSSAPSNLTSAPLYLPNRIRSPTLKSQGRTCPFSRILPLPTATILPCTGFSAAVSGITMPPGEVRSSSRRFTITRSWRGRIFIVGCSLKVACVLLKQLLHEDVRSQLQGAKATPNSGKTHTMPNQVGEVARFQAFCRNRGRASRVAL